MAWFPLKSTNLAAYDYDEAMRVLHVKFQSGRVFSYRDVPAEVGRGLAEAESPGRYFGSEVKGRFQPI